VPVVGIFACTAPLATYATQVYPEVPAALATMIAVASVTGRWSARSADVRRRRGRAPWLSIKYGLVAGALVAVAAWRLRRRRPTLLALTGTLAAAAAVYLAVHQAIYGGWTAYATGDHFSEAGELSVVGSRPNYLGRARRLVGLLVDDGFGIGAWMIGWLLLPFAIGHLARQRPANWQAIAVPLAAGWLTATFVALTMHGWWWPGRQIVVVLPLAVIAIALALDAGETPCGAASGWRAPSVSRRGCGPRSRRSPAAVC
jgi:hypothetical protein